MTTLTDAPTIHHCEQLSAEWWELRRGIPTASSFDKILTPAKAQPSASQDDYIAELVAERYDRDNPFTRPDGGFTSGLMDEGLRREPEARNWYAMQTDADVKLAGFVVSPCGRFGCSPDGLIGGDGGLEMKNPAAKTHVRYLLDGGLPNQYRCQVHGSLVVTGRKWWDFVSYFPGLPTLLIRVVPDDFTDKLRTELERFHTKYLAAVSRIEAM